MRIIAGQLKRKSIRAPQGHLTRPTTDRTRESLFHLVEARLALREAEVLDLFAGTGALGLEAISRGARFVTFVENERRVMQVARDNADTLDVSDQGRFVPGDAVHFLETYNGPPFDLIMADPPYDLDAMDRLPDLALPHVREGGLLTLEHDTRIFFDEHPHLDTSRPYGRTIVSVFRKST
ncbi:MAG: 16S rRNA (guanine(966)-N(2))-methyltransferase RsmD [Bacteroidetes bacterium QS_8_64_10]|nr:MAG: 16S rRNA (guanine(966)-N(2))-methyltransferase RsmD [Bacteroidetes bacterium QS_8_64_10]